MGETIDFWTATALPAALAGLLLAQAAVRLHGRARRRDRAWERLARCLRERSAVAPRLTSIAGFYLSWNDPLLTAVGTARREALRARGVAERTCREADLSWALGRLMALLEDQPMLARHAGLASIGEALDRTENAAAARLAYNEEADALARLRARPLCRLAARLMRQARPEPFDLDPYLARQAMTAHPVALPTPRAAEA